MFSPSPHYNSGGNSDDAHRDPVFFKDPEEFYEPHNSYYAYPEGDMKLKDFNSQSRPICTQMQPNRSVNPFRDLDNTSRINRSAGHSQYETGNKNFDSVNANKYYYDENENDAISGHYNNNPFKTNYQASRNINGKQTNSYEIFDSSPGNYPYGRDSGTTCASSDDNNAKYPLIEKDPYNTAIKVTDVGSGSTIGSRKLLTARRQLMVTAYFKSFKIMALITFLLFFCLLISTILNLSCVSRNTFCLPKFEIQSSGPVENESHEVNLFTSLTMQPIHRDTTSSLEYALGAIEKFLNELSGLVLDSTFNPVLIRSKIGEAFENENSVIFKFSNFGYCKQIVDKYVIESTCHPYFGYGIDVPSVFIKDLAYTLSFQEIEGDAEYVSNIFAKNYRDLFNFLKIKEYRDNRFLFYGFLSSILSISSSYMSIIEFVLDLSSLITCVIISFVFKSKANRILSAYTKYLFESNAKRHFSEQHYQFARVQEFLIGVTIVIWISTIMRILGVTYELVYILQIESVLKSLNLRLIEGIKLVSSGTVLDILNVLIHLCVSICLTSCVLCKPWIVKITI
ncbi:hypothetical protein PMKS-000295 [Pichia membranifaciens]|uniref:Uncharacterized protein n=1 Tax=Pichia membranifaciens TaxID=4926 RepID=A0A1Q2YBD0_9ASCO|nr:hypothetical protein PMKS-000295 [Pichia membranifaciens]